MAWDTAGVGVYLVPSDNITSTLFAASTCNALENAGSDSACVSIPRKSGPSIFCALRRSEEHTSELQSRLHLVCRLLLEKKKHTTHPRPRPQPDRRALAEYGEPPGDRVPPGSLRRCPPRFPAAVGPLHPRARRVYTSHRS